MQAITAALASTTGYFTIMWFDGPGGITQEEPSLSLQVLAQVWVLATIGFFALGWKTRSTRSTLTCIAFSFALFVGFYYAHLAERIAADDWRTACDEGDARACYALATLHYDGHGVAADLQRANALDLLACTLEHPAGCARLARDADGPLRDQACQALRDRCNAGKRADCDAQGRFCGKR